MLFVFVWLLLLQNISTDDKFEMLKILPLNKQLTFNKAIIAHKIYHNKAPPYLSPLFKKATDRYGSVRLTLPSVRIDIFKSSLAYSGSVLWNREIPNNLKGVSSTLLFKKQFRKHLLLRWYFDNMYLSYPAYIVLTKYFAAISLDTLWSCRLILWKLFLNF